mgnify:CR=1 FL=1
MFASFAIFWTGAPIVLMSPPYNYSGHAVALFTLSGVFGVCAAPVAGRLADRGYIRTGTIAAMSLAVAALLAASVAGGSMALFILAGILVDLGVPAKVLRPRFPPATADLSRSAAAFFRQHEGQRRCRKGRSHQGDGRPPEGFQHRAGQRRPDSAPQKEDRHVDGVQPASDTVVECEDLALADDQIGPVSYTHLTLPTSDLV